LDSQHFATVLNTAQLLWWNVAKKDPESTIELGTKSPINCLALSGDGKTAIVGYRADGMVGVWDISERKLVKKWVAHAGDVVAAAFAPDGKRVATVGQDNLGKVWDPKTGSQSLTLKGHKDVPLAVAFSADGALIVTAGTDKTVRLWSAKSGEPQPTMLRADEKIFSLALDPKGRYLVAGLDGGALQLFLLPAGKR
jgi:WD40 repeat protein